jgi:hypothetical protein
MLLASRGLRDHANYANEVGELRELAAEGVGDVLLHEARITPNQFQAGSTRRRWRGQAQR